MIMSKHLLSFQINNDVLTFCLFYSIASAGVSIEKLQTAPEKTFLKNFKI